MKVTATIDGASVTIVDIDATGSEVVVSYIKADNTLISKRMPWPYQSQYSSVLATSATSIS